MGRGAYMRRIALMGLLAVLLTSCGRPGRVTTVAGSTSVQPLVEVLAEAYARAGGERVRIQGGGSAAGIRAVQDGVATVGASSRHLSPAEANGLQVHLVALDALVVIVHPSNPVSAMTVAQVRQIFTGAVRRWPDGRSIRLLTREHGSGTREAMVGFLAPAGPIDRRALVMNAGGAIRAAVAADPQAVGYVSIAALSDGGVRPVLIGGVDPTPDNVRGGRYPLSRPFLLITKEGDGFVRFALGPVGRGIVESEGMVPPR